MNETTDRASQLVSLAAEGIATVIPGCVAAIVTAKESRNAAFDATPPKAINHFGHHIVERWMAAMHDQPEIDQRDTLTQLANLTLSESRSEATTAVERFAGEASAEDKALAVEYLTAIPLMVRRSLVQDPETGRMTLPNAITTNGGQGFIHLLPPDVPPFTVGSSLPDTTYRLEELLGIGGFGAVYKAKNRCEQHQPPRAIKFCLDASMVATLHRERAILDRLMSVDGSKWSNRIVRLYGYDLDAKPPFLVYEYVSGGDLTSYLRATKQKTGRGCPPDVALDLVRQVTEALAFAHGQGLVHRDLKPANVLMSGTKIKLTDFGIGGVVATHAMRNTVLGGSMLSQASSADQTSLFRGSGTPLYMSPEQRRGDQPDPRHDLYSLGVMWYQLLVGDVSHELHPGWQEELIEEYQTPREHTEIIQRCVGYFKKRPANAMELLALLPNSTGLRSGSSPSISLPPAPAAEPARPPSVSTPSKPEAIFSPRFEAEFQRLHQILTDQIERDAFAEARETVSAILRINPNDEETLEVRALLDERLTSRINELHCFHEHQGWVRSVAASSDGRRALSASDDHTVLLWDLDGRRQLRCFVGHTAAVMSVAFAPDNRSALTGSWDATARLWDADSGRELRRFVGSWKAVKSVAFAPDATRILLGTDERRVHLIDIETGREQLCLDGHSDLVQSVAFAPDGHRAISGGDDSTLRLWDLESGREIRRYTGHTDSVTSVAFAPNGRWILSGSSDNTARLWEANTGKELRRFAGHSNWINCIAFAQNSLRIVTGSGGEIVGDRFQDGSDTTVRVWDVQSERELCRFEKHEASVTSVAFVHGGRLLISGSLDKTVRLLLVPS